MEPDDLDFGVQLIVVWNQFHTKILNCVIKKRSNPRGTHLMRLDSIAEKGYLYMKDDLEGNVESMENRDDEIKWI